MFVASTVTDCSKLRRSGMNEELVRSALMARCILQAEPRQDWFARHVALSSWH